MGISEAAPLPERQAKGRVRFRMGTCLYAAILTLLWIPAAHAQEPDTQSPTAQVNIVCVSTPGQRQECPADTSAGVLLVRSTGDTACLLGKNWGYDDTGIWVADGCSGEFAAGQAAPVGIETQAPTTAAAAPPPEPIETFGFLDPGKGFLIGRGDHGELSVSAYALLRYINQMPADQTFTDHLGREHTVKARNDIFSHRVLVWLNGWVGSPKLRYQIAFWTVTDTDQKAIFGNIGYQFSRKFSLYGGINGNPGSRSLQGSHPYWLGHDRVMADEFFRPFFTQGVWANGELVDGLWYRVMAGNSNSILGVTASQLDRRFTYGGSMWWMPTTKEFGPRGGYGDWEMHEKVATRFGFSTVWSPEQRLDSGNLDAPPGNTSVRLADSINVFDTGALAGGVTVQNYDYRILAVDAGVKYRGFFLQTELYQRRLGSFLADGPLPVETIDDWGFYVQGSFFPVPRKLEVYGATSQIFGDKGAGFDNSSDYLVGANIYPFNTRNHRLNFQVINVNRSPVNSVFGYYTGGQDGTTVSVAMSVFF